jgi:transposase
MEKTMKRKIPEIREDFADIKQRYRSEKHPRKKQRLFMLYLLKSQQAKTMQEVAFLLALGRNTIGQWLARYEKEGLPGLLDIRTHPNRPQLTPPAIIEQLQEKLRTPQGFRSYKAIWQWLRDECKLNITYKTTHNLVRYRLKAKLKVPRKSHIKKDQKKRKNTKSIFLTP